MRKGTTRRPKEVAEVTGGAREAHKAPKHGKGEIWGHRRGGGGTLGTVGTVGTPPSRQSLLGVTPQSLCRDSEFHTL